MKNIENPSVIVYGAFDRHNYGDLLFALVVDQYLERNFGVKPIIASSKKSDLTEYGALKTIAIGDALFELSKTPLQNCKLIIAGGEVLTARWENILGYIGNPFYYYLLRVVAKLSGGKLFSRVASRINGIEAALPFVPKAPVLGEIPVYYNAVGGSELLTINGEFRPYIRENLGLARHLSVRDSITSKSLSELGVDSVISPDSAILMSEMYSSSDLEKVVSSRFVNELNQRQGYIIFQISEYHARGRIDKISDELAKFSRATGYQVGLLSIGKASGHSDDLPLTRIYKNIPDISFKIDGGNIFEIMLAIAKSKIYCGTSLHGAITSMAYGVPHVGLLPVNVPKLKNFLESWSLSEVYRSVEEDQIFESLLSLSSIDDAKYAEFMGHVKILQNLVHLNFLKIMSS